MTRIQEKVLDLMSFRVVNFAKAGQRSFRVWPESNPHSQKIRCSSSDLTRSSFDEDSCYGPPMGKWCWKRHPANYYATNHWCWQTKEITWIKIHPGPQWVDGVDDSEQELHNIDFLNQLEQVYLTSPRMRKQCAGQETGDLLGLAKKANFRRLFLTSSLQEANKTSFGNFITMIFVSLEEHT